MDVKDITGKKAVILGAARSGLAAAKLLSDHGALVFVSDLADDSGKPQEKAELQGMGIPFEFGQHSERVFEADFIVLSPGIPVASAVVRKLLAQNTPVYSEIEVAYWFCRSPIIAVTGSNGKTTTTTLIGEMLKKEQPKAILAGNIGQALAGMVDASSSDSWAAVEVSSFQLETIRDFHPKVAVVLNLAPNHLDRYDSYDSYVEAKLRLLMNMDENDTLIYNADDQLLSSKIKQCPARKMGFSLNQSQANAQLKKGKIIIDGQQIISVEEVRLKGPHNMMNAMAAGLAVKAAGISNDSVRSVLKSFAGVEHRLEPVRTIDGIKYINDSKATTVESLQVGLRSFSEPVILIAGGKDKGSDFTKLNDDIKEHVRDLILIGTAAEKMAAAWKALKPVHFASTLQEAVDLAQKMAVKNNVVLLSPACASFDMFDNYEQRGNVFKEIVNGLEGSE